jgi:nitroreductase
MKPQEMLSFIKSRYSPRAFAEKEITLTDLNMIFEAASWAPSSYNAQPWRFVYAKKGTDAYNTILASMIEWNQLWAKSAPVLVVAAMTKNYENNGNPYHHAMHDLGMALGNINIQALSQDIYLHYIGGFDAAKLSKDMDIPSGIEVVTVIALGNRGSDDRIPADIAEATNTNKRVRKPVSAIAFENKIE